MDFSTELEGHGADQRGREDAGMWVELSLGPAKQPRGGAEHVAGAAAGTRASPWW